MAPLRVALALVALLSVASMAQEPPDPRERLTRAEELACAGRYAEARALYARVAADQGGTPEGRLASARAAESAFLGSCELVSHGPPANRVDIALLGDGYELDHLRALRELAEDVPPLFARLEPFREYWSYFNFVRGVCLSAEAGIDGFGREYDTLLGGITLGTDAGHVGIDVRRARSVLEQIPGNDGLAIVFVKLGVSGTGSEGLAVVGGRDARTTVHEWGHAFARLGDEYSERTHQRGPVRDGINVAASDDPERVPWRHWLVARHPSVGIYEGASGQAMGAWRPTASGCVMNDGEAFCPVCREALVLRIYALVDPIDEVTPSAPPSGIREPILLWQDPVEIRVRTLRPATHDLDVRWWIEPADSTSSVSATPGTAAAPRQSGGDRKQRGPLADMGVPPSKSAGAGKDGESTLRLTRADLEPGLYRITCRVRDSTEPRGERWPWVLRDERGLLESERVWWLEVR